MIKVTVELVPWHSPEEGRRVIGSADIWNTGEDSLVRGSYRAQLYGKGGRKLGGEVELEGFERKRRNVWDLVGLLVAKARKLN